MLIVIHRNTFLKETEIGAVMELKFRHAQKGEPALNRNLRMTLMEAGIFSQMLRDGMTEYKDVVAGRISTYTVTED